MSLGRSHLLQDMSIEAYLEAFESPDAWDKTPEQQQKLYSNSWFLKYLLSRCPSDKVDATSFKYYETPNLWSIGDEEERHYASGVKRRLKEMARAAFKQFQKEAYLSSPNPEVAKAAAEKKQADANAKKSAAKAGVNAVAPDEVVIL